MALYRFRVTFEDYDDISRDIDVKSNGSSVSLDGSLVCQKPRNFKLVGLGLAVLAVAVVAVQLLRKKFAKREG